VDNVVAMERHFPILRAVYIQMHQDTVVVVVQVVLQTAVVLHIPVAEAAALVDMPVPVEPDLVQHMELVLAMEMQLVPLQAVAGAGAEPLL
jgi:hypothetical protein